VVHLIGDDQEIVLAAELRQAQAARGGKGVAAGVLEGGDGIEEGGALFLQRLLQRFDHQPVLIDCDRRQAQVVVGENPQREEVRRLLDEDHVARAGIERAGQVQPQRGAVGNEQ